MAILGIVAAAGASGRMGSPKALLSTRLFDDDGVDEPWVRRLARALREGGVDELVVTIPDGPTGGAVAAAVADLARTARNPRPDEGLTGSVIAALDAAAAAGVDVEALVICPVDAPGVSAVVIAAVVESVRQQTLPVVVTHAGHPGHPVAFPRSAFAALRAAGRAGGPRAVLASGPVRALAIDDPRVLWDLDTRDEIAAVVEDRRRPC